jgi:hypothetical protein
MPRVSVDFFWRRADPALLGDDLFGLVPYWLDEGFGELRDAGLIVGVEGTGELITTLLWLADLPADLTPDDLDTDTPGVLPPDEVTAIAAVLAGVEPEALVQQFRGELDEAALEMDRRPIDDRGAKALADDLARLTALFTSAAAAGQAVVVTVVA